MVILVREDVSGHDFSGAPSKPAFGLLGCGVVLFRAFYTCHPERSARQAERESRDLGLQHDEPRFLASPSLAWLARADSE